LGARFSTPSDWNKGFEPGRKTIAQILIANDLWRPQTRQRRPRCYQNLCQRSLSFSLALNGGAMEK
jgi:hypothetical protein